MSTRYIFGSHGEFEINEEGLPVGEVPAAYKKAIRFDVKEYDDWCQKHSNHPKLKNVDILSIGVWVSHEGGEKYLRAVEAWRKCEVDGWPPHLPGHTPTENEPTHE